MNMTYGDFRFRATFAIYWKLKGKILPEGLRAKYGTLEDSLHGNGAGNAWENLVAFAEALPDYADELKTICTENE